MEQTITDLVNRVNRLETQQRRSRLFALLAMVAAIGIVWTDRNPMPAATDVVAARKFVLLNEAGDEAADLGLVDHLPALTFRGPLEQTLGRLTSRELLMQDAGPEQVQRVRLNDTGLTIRGRRTTQVKEEPLINLSVEAGPSLSMIRAFRRT